MSSQPHDSVPGLDPDCAKAAVQVLEGRLVSLLDLQLTLKHIHWNVVGPSFLSVHEMVDRMVGPVRDMSDAVAERIRALGGIPKGTPAAIVANRDWDDYALLTESVYIHLKELDSVFYGVIEDNRSAISELGRLDPISEDLLLTQTAQLEGFQWFVRSFFERSHAGAPDEVSSATRASERRDATRGSERRDATRASERRDATRGSERRDADRQGSADTAPV